MSTGFSCQQLFYHLDTQKEVQLFAQNVTGINRKLRLTDVNGKHRIFSLSASPTTKGKLT